MISKRNGFIMAFLAPGILLFAIIYAYPLINIFVTSFCTWNYKNFLSPEFLGWRFARNAFIIPNIISTAAIGLIFLNLYNPSRGVVTEIFNLIKPGSNVSVLANETYAFWGVTFSFILFGGSSCILLLTQIFSIDPSLYEAARVDGASGWQIDRNIVLPLLRPMLGTVSFNLSSESPWSDVSPGHFG